MTAFSTNKGKRFEREIADAFRAVYPGAKRGFQFRGGGAEVPDVTGIPTWHIECKVGARPNPLAALEQAFAEAEEGRIPIAICKKDRCRTTVTMELETFLVLCANEKHCRPCVKKRCADCSQKNIGVVVGGP